MLAHMIRPYAVFLVVLFTVPCAQTGLCLSVFEPGPNRTVTSAAEVVAGRVPTEGPSSSGASGVASGTFLPWPTILDRMIADTGDEEPELPESFSFDRLWDSPGFRTMTKYGLIILGIIAAILVFLAYVARAVKQPAEISIWPLAEALKRVDEESTFIRDQTATLESLGFRPLLDFTIPELPHRGFFRLMGTESEDHTVLLHELETPAKGGGMVKYLEFQTILSNGIKINTNNAPMKGPLRQPPHVVLACHPNVTRPHQLFDLHRAETDRVQSRKGGWIRPERFADFQHEFTREWRENMEYQEKVGLVRKTADGREYQGRLMLILRYFTPESLRRK